MSGGDSVWESLRSDEIMSTDRSLLVVIVIVLVYYLTFGRFLLVSDIIEVETKITNPKHDTTNIT